MNFSVCLVIFQNILNNNHGLITTYGKMKLFSRMPLGGCVERKSGAEKEKCLMKFYLNIKKATGGYASEPAAMESGMDWLLVLRIFSGAQGGYGET